MCAERSRPAGVQGARQRGEGADDGDAQSTASSPS